MFADLVVLSADPTAVAPDKIGAIDVLLTMVGGRVVYRRGGFGGAAAVEHRRAASAAAADHRAAPARPVAAAEAEALTRGVAIKPRHFANPSLAPAMGVVLKCADAFFTAPRFSRRSRFDRLRLR